MGSPNSWLAQVDYAYEGRNEIERSCFTLVLTEAEASAGFAVRVLCHDRGLSKRDRANPDSDREVVKLDDRAVRLESDRFLERYAVSTDHDQDQLAVWQLFSPSLIDWLTNEAPAGFSFELQDGALSCFVPGYTAEEGELDALCAAAARVFARVAQIDGGGGEARAPREGGREDLVDRQLAAHPFAAPPQSTKAAAKAFRRGLTLGDQAWALGSEAFFREHAAAVGFRHISTAAFRAGHIDTFVPGDLAHAAQGRLGSDLEAFLVFTNDASYEDMGWSVLVVALRSPSAGPRPGPERAARGHLEAGLDPGRQRRALADPLRPGRRRPRPLRQGIRSVLRRRRAPGGTAGGLRLLRCSEFKSGSPDQRSVSARSRLPSRIPLRTQHTKQWRFANGNRNREVVQRRQGLRLHHSR